MQVSKPDYTTSIVSVLAGETIPEAFLLQLLTENRSAIGFVVQDKKLEIEKFTGLSTVENEMANIRAVLSNTMKYNRVFCFSAFPSEFDEDEVQPWRVLKDSKGNPVIAVAIEGDFPLAEGNGDSEMLAMINDTVGPKIEAMYQLLGNNPTKLYAAMKDKVFADDLLSNVGHRGHFVFMPITGDVFSHFKEDEASPQNGKFKWGSASFTYGYTEDEPEPVKVPEKEKHSPKLSKYAVPQADATPAPTKTDDKGIHHIQQPTAVPLADPKADPVKDAAAKVTDGHWETPPASVHGKSLKSWYRGINFTAGVLSPNGKEGDLPQDWKKRPRVWVQHKTVIKDLKDLSQTALGTSVQVPPASELPVISGAEQAGANEFIKKFLDAASNQIDNPLELQKKEAKLAIFSELCLGGNLDRIEKWATSGKLAFIKQHPTAAWLLMNELILDRIKRKTAMALGDKKLGEITGTAPEIIPVPEVKPIAPSPKPAPDVHTPKKISKYA